MTTGIQLRHVLRAMAIELVALVVYAPAFLEGMMRHSAAAPRGAMENASNAAAFILHLPTILITYPFDGLVLLTPITQVVFWAWLFSFLDSRRQAGRRAQVR